jgi:hypothetical protein
MESKSTISTVFRRCVEAIKNNVLIHRESSNDKEFHFQNWFKNRLEDESIHFESQGRNSFPDFSIVKYTEGYELKGLAYPGRDASYDANSQMPKGFFNGRTIYYVFGRYPKKPDGNQYPVLDLVICHGDFLNADHEYVHKNRSVKCFGSYGDIMIRDRKMYVVPTPFRLIDGSAHNLTLVLPADQNPGRGFFEVGDLQREEANELIVGYAFNLRTNEISSERIVNPNAGKLHLFKAWRLNGSPATAVSMKSISGDDIDAEMDDEE